MFCLSVIPVTFRQKLKNLQVEEGQNITLHCEISKPGVPVEWRLGGELLENGDKYQIKQRDSNLDLTIIDAALQDSGVYSCVCREQKTKATVKIIGMFVVCETCRQACYFHLCLLFVVTCANEMCCFYQLFLPHLK